MVGFTCFKRFSSSQKKTVTNRLETSYILQVRLHLHVSKDVSMLVDMHFVTLNYFLKVIRLHVHVFQKVRSVMLGENYVVALN
jgi:hypothetical protein